MKSCATVGAIAAFVWSVAMGLLYLSVPHWGVSDRALGPRQICFPSDQTNGSGSIRRGCTVSSRGVVLITRYDSFLHTTALELARSGHIVIVGVSTETEKKAFDIYYGPESKQGGVKGLESVVLDLSEPADILKVVQRVEQAAEGPGRGLTAVIVNHPLEHVRANGDKTPPSAVPWGIDVTGTDFYYNHWLKGSVRLLQGIAPLIQNTTRPTRVMLVEDGWLRMNGANCGAKCAVTNAVHDTFTQMRRAMLRSESTSTSSVITVLKPGLLNNATTATSVLSQAIWESVVQVLHPVPTIGWLDQWRLRRVANISSSEIIRKNTRVYGVQVPSQLVVSVSGDHSEDKLTIDLGCDFALKWFEGANQYCRVSVPYSVLHFVFHALGTRVQEVLLDVVTSSGTVIHRM